MDEFYLKHDKPHIIQKIRMVDFRCIGFWKHILRKIPPLIRKLAEYYHIPSSEYPIIEVIFSDERWEEWQLVSGKRNKLGTITGGTYFDKSSRIELNPYIYLFEDGVAFIGVIYHELAHWIIDKVDYLNETVYDDQRRATYHLLDFLMVLNDIYDIPDEKDKWAHYRLLKQHHAGFNRYMESEQTLDSICIHPDNFEEDGEHYTGSFLAVENGFCVGFCVDS